MAEVTIWAPAIALGITLLAALLWVVLRSRASLCLRAPTRQEPVGG
jgi:hypothetical protein